MTQRGPGNGYYWTPREMMMRRDHIRWRNAHTLLRFAPLGGAVIGFPVGTAYGVAAFVISCLVQAYYVHSAFSDARHQFSAPIMIQRVFAALTVLTSAGAAAIGGADLLNAAFAAALWFILLWIIEGQAMTEGEIDRANREATHIEETWIKE